MDDGLMTIGQLATRTGTPIRALRRYTDLGLVYTVGRSPANYRLYDESAAWCVLVIGSLRRLGSHHFRDPQSCQSVFGGACRVDRPSPRPTPRRS